MSNTTQRNNYIDLPHTRNHAPLPAGHAGTGTGGATLRVQYQIRRAGQQLPAYGDDVIAIAELYLPMSETHTPWLDPQLQFEERCKVWGDPLNSDWGLRGPRDGEDNEHQRPTNCRYLWQEFHAPTWKQAFDEAELYVRTEVQRLVDALTARHAALLAAERAMLDSTPEPRRTITHAFDLGSGTDKLLIQEHSDGKLNLYRASDQKLIASITDEESHLVIRLPTIFDAGPLSDYGVWLHYEDGNEPDAIQWHVSAAYTDQQSGYISVRKPPF